jgi:ketosteroid isomerase-like protein
MSTITTSAQLDIAALTEAITSRDAEGVVAWYTDDAVLTVVDRDHPPTSPATFEGKAAVTAYFTDICGRHLEHAVQDLVQTTTGLAFTQDCRYPDGTRVLCATVAQVEDGRIRRQTVVQAWDPA